MPYSRKGRSAGRAHSRWNDAVPVDAPEGARSGTAKRVASTRQIHLHRRAIANGLTAGSGVHLRRLLEPVVPVVRTCTATFMVFFSGSPTA